MCVGILCVTCLNTYVKSEALEENYICMHTYKQKVPYFKEKIIKNKTHPHESIMLYCIAGPLKNVVLNGLFRPFFKLIR